MFGPSKHPGTHQIFDMSFSPSPFMRNHHIPVISPCVLQGETTLSSLVSLVQRVADPLLQNAANGNGISLYMLCTLNLMADPCKQMYPNDFHMDGVEMKIDLFQIDMLCWYTPED